MTLTRPYPTALVQVGPYQITVELPVGTEFGDPAAFPEIAKSIAAGLTSAYETYPPQASV